MSTEASLARYYADRAKEYDAIYLKPERQAELDRLRSLVERTFTGTHVFELACGTGYWTEILARSAASVFATDINEEVLAIARSRPIRPGRVTFQVADAYALPEFSRKFNAGFSGFWWSHIPRRRLQEFLRGFHRALSPGARVVFMDNVYVAGSSTPIARTDEHGDTYQVRRLEGGTTHEVLKNFPSESTLRSAVEGMAEQVTVQFLQYYWILSYATLRAQPASGRRRRDSGQPS